MLYYCVARDNMSKNKSYNNLGKEGLVKLVNVSSEFIPTLEERDRSYAVVVFDFLKKQNLEVYLTDKVLHDFIPKTLSEELSSKKLRYIHFEVTANRNILSNAYTKLMCLTSPQTFPDVKSPLIVRKIPEEGAVSNQKLFTVLVKPGNNRQSSEDVFIFNPHHSYDLISDELIQRTQPLSSIYVSTIWPKI
jgi:hypothetical protein